MNSEALASVRPHEVSIRSVTGSGSGVGVGVAAGAGVGVGSSSPQPTIPSAITTSNGKMNQRS